MKLMKILLKERISLCEELYNKVIHIKKEDDVFFKEKVRIMLLEEKRKYVNRLLDLKEV